MTTLYLVRHAIAADAKPGQPDADRPLTPEGIKKFRQAANGFLHLINPKEISHLLTSPLLRAQQTAQILAQALQKNGRSLKPQLCPPLGNPPSFEKFLQQLHTLKKPTGILAIGHEPTLSDWIAFLCMGGGGNIQLKKGAIAALQLPKEKNAPATLLFLLQPKILRAIKYET